jgi:hypothetical protein
MGATFRFENDKGLHTARYAFHSLLRLTEFPAEGKMKGHYILSAETKH